MLKINIESFITYLNFATILIGIFAFFDFVIKFRRPYNFKIFYSLFILSLLFLNILIWLKLPFFDIVRFSPLINFGIWCAGLYTLSILISGKIEKWVWWSSAVIFTLNFYNFYMLMNLQGNAQGEFSVFSAQIHQKFNLINLTRFAQRLILLVSIVILYQKIKKNKLDNNFYQKKLFRWIGIYVVFVFISMITNFLVSYFFNQSLFKSNNYFIIYSLLCLGIFILTIYRPNFINNQNISKLNFKRFTIQDDFKLTDSNFFIPFFSQHYFLNKDATIEDFCTRNDIQEKDSFNEYIINKYNMSFSNLINKNRVDYFIFLAKDSKFKNFTVEALAKEVGFSSRTALYKPFKKFHGGTPMDFIESINN